MHLKLLVKKYLKKVKQVACVQTFNLVVQYLKCDFEIVHQCIVTKSNLSGLEMT